MRFYKDEAAARAAGWKPDFLGRWIPPPGRPGKIATLLPPVPAGTMLTIRVRDAESGVRGSFKVDDMGRVREFTFVPRPTGWRSDPKRRRPFGAAPARLLNPVRGHLIPRSLMNSLQFSEARWNLIWQGSASNAGAFREVERDILAAVRDRDTRRVVVSGVVNYNPQDAYDVASVSFSGKVRTIGRDGVRGHVMELFNLPNNPTPNARTLANL